MRWATCELLAVLREWWRGNGDLIGLLQAWYQVVTDRVKVDEPRYMEGG